MFDITLVPHRNPLLTSVFNEYKPQGTYLQDAPFIPHLHVDMLTNTIADMTYTDTTWKGTWTWGSEIPMMVQSMGGSKTFTLSMFARGLSIPIDKLNEKLPAFEATQVRIDATQAVARVMKSAIEQKYIDLLTNPANYAEGFSSSPTKKWDASDCTVQKDIVDVLNKMTLLDLPITHVIIPKKVLMALTLNQTFITMLNNAHVPKFIVDTQVINAFTGIPVDKIYTPEVFNYGHARAIDLSQPNAAFNAATQIWTDDVIFLHIEEAGMGTYPSLVSLDYMPPVVQQLPLDQETLDTKFIGRQATSPILQNNNAAYLLHDVLS